MNTNYQDEVEINLVHMALTMVTKWKSLIIAAIIGLAAGFLIAGIKDPYGFFNSIGRVYDDESDEVTLPEYIDTLKKDEQKELKESFLKYQSYKSMYDETMDYLNNSLIMNMDSQNLYRAYTDVYVNCGRDTLACEKLLTNVLSDEATYENIRKVSGLDVDTKYLQGIITGSSSSSANTTVTVNTSSTSSITASSTDGGSASNNTIGDVYTYQIVYDDSAVLSSMMDALNESVGQAVESIAENYTGGSVFVIGCGVTPYQTTEYINLQSTFITSLATYNTQLESLSSSFEDYNYGAKNYIKYMLIGLIAGAFLWAIYLSALYLLGGTVKTMDDIRTMGVDRVYGIKSETKGRTNIITDLLEKSEGKKVTFGYVENALKESERTGKAYIYKLAGDNWTDTDVPDSLNGQTVEEGLISEDSDTYNNALTAGSVLMIVKLGSSRMSEVREEIEAARKDGVKVSVVGV